MLLRVELGSFLRRYVSDYDPSEGIRMFVDNAEAVTMHNVIRKLGLPAESVQVVTVNRNAAAFDTPLHDGDRVGLFSAASGG